MAITYGLAFYCQELLSVAALSDFCSTRRQVEGRDATPMEEDELLQDVCEAARLGNDFTSSIERTR